MNPKDHAEQTWVAIGGPETGRRLTGQEASIERPNGHYRLDPLDDSGGYYWAWRPAEDTPLDDPADPNFLEGTLLIERPEGGADEEQLKVLAAELERQFRWAKVTLLARAAAKPCPDRAVWEFDHKKVQQALRATEDPWKHRSSGMKCQTCMWFVEKAPGPLGRCRRHSPTMNGYPVVFPDDWCGDHKLDEAKS